MIEPIESNAYTGLRLSDFDSNLCLPRHRWYQFKEGFSELLVRKAIQGVKTPTRPARILDPFSGSGTSLVTAGRFGCEGLGIEVNPFLAFAARAKCTSGKWTKAGFEKSLERILSSSRHEIQSPLEGFSTFTEKPSLKKWLFNKSLVRGFTALDRSIAGFPAYRRPLRLALFASVMDCCNARRDGKCLRYRKDWESLGFNSSNLREIFQRRARETYEDVSQHRFDARKLTVLNADSRTKLKGLKRNQFDLLITSPPYLNSFDYSDVYRPELFLGGFVGNNEELRRLRLRTVRSHVQVKWKPSPLIASSLLKPILEQLSGLELWSSYLPEMIRSYFVDMATVLKNASNLVRKNGEAWIVVATSAYGGVEVPVDLILADVATRNGWLLDGVYVLRQMRSAGQHWTLQEDRKRLPLRESLIILKRGKS